MDYDPSQSSAAAVYGADGCFDPDHGNNAGLSDIWSPGRPLFDLHSSKYSHISKADFWVASANAVIRQTSVGNALNMKTSFKWGRKDKASCPGSGERLPIPSRCSEVDRVFRTRMGLSWRDAVALLGAHTLGRGDRSVSFFHLYVLLCVCVPNLFTLYQILYTFCMYFDDLVKKNTVLPSRGYMERQ